MTKTSPRRIPRRRGDSSRQAAFTFLSNISLDNNDRRTQQPQLPFQKSHQKQNQNQLIKHQSEEQGELNASSNIPINNKHDKASSFPIAIINKENNNTNNTNYDSNGTINKDNKKPDLHIDTKKAFSTIEKVSNNEATTGSHVTSKTRISPDKKIFNNDKTSPIVLKEGHIDYLNSSSDIRLRSNSLREEAAINFLTNINLDSNRNQHPSRESLTSPTTISVFEANDDNLLNEVDDNVGNQENLEGSSSSPSSAYVRRRRSSASTLNSDASSSSSISYTLSNSPNHPTATTSLSITRNKLEQHRPNKQADNVINTNPISNSTSIGDQNNNRKQQQSGVGSFLTTSAPLGIFSMLGYSDKKSKNQRNHKENLYV